MRTPTRMMSHIYSENIIYMSPFPSFEIPKMSRFCPNNIDYSSIIDGEYLSSLHPTPVSSWLDFRYKEKKKRNRSGGNQKNKIGNNNKRNDVALFYFSTVLYCATEFMFSSHNFSRKYRYFDREFYLGLIPVQNVPGSTLSTSCVRCVQRSSFFQYSLHVQILLKHTKEMPSETSFMRHSFSHAPTFKLHLKDLNLTQLIHLLRTNEFNQSISLLQANDNKKKSDSNNSNNDSNSSSIVSLYYLIIERVFQNDGECIVIRLSTLIDKQKENEFCKEKEEGKVLLFPISNSSNETEQDEEETVRVNDISIVSMIKECQDQYDRHIKTSTARKDNNCKCTVYNVSIDNSNIDNNNDDAILLILQVLSNRTIIGINQKGNSNSKSTNNANVASNQLSKLAKYHDNDNNNDNCIGPDESVLNLLIPNVSTNRTGTECEVYSINDVIQEEHETKRSWKTGEPKAAKHIARIPYQDCCILHNKSIADTSVILNRNIINEDNFHDASILIQEECSNKECVLIILLSKPVNNLSNHTCTVQNETRTVRNENDCNNCNVSILYCDCFLLHDPDIIVMSLSLLLSNVSKRTMVDHGMNSIDDFIINGCNASTMTMVSKRTSSVIIEVERDEKNHIISNNSNVHNVSNLLTLLSELSKCNDDDYNEVSVQIIQALSLNRIDSDNKKKKNIDKGNDDARMKRREEKEQNVISVSLIDGECCVMIILLSKLSKHNEDGYNKARLLILLLNLVLFLLPKHYDKANTSSEILKPPIRNCTVHIEDNCNKYNAVIPFRDRFLHNTSIINKSVLIILSKLVNRIDVSNNDTRSDNKLILIIVSNLMNRNKDCEDESVSIIIFKPLNHTSNDDDNYASVPTLIFQVSSIDSNNKNSIDSKENNINDDSKNMNNVVGVSSRKEANSIDVSIDSGNGNDKNNTNVTTLLLYEERNNDNNDNKASGIDNKNSTSDSINNDTSAVILLSKLLKRNDDNDNNNKKYSDLVLILLSELSKRNHNDNIDGSVRNNTRELLIISSTRIFIQDERSNKETSIDGEETYSIDTNIKDDATNDGCVLAIQLLSSRTDRNKKKSSSTSIVGTSVCILLSKRTNSNDKERDYENAIDSILILNESDDESILILLSVLLSKQKKEERKREREDSIKDSADNYVSNIDNKNTPKVNNIYHNNNIERSSSIDQKAITTRLTSTYTTDNSMNCKLNNHITTTALTTYSDSFIRHDRNSNNDNSIVVSQLCLFMGSVCTLLFHLLIAMRSSTALTTCILRYKYDTILKALFVFNCSILYWIFTIDGEYQNLQRVRILVDDISLCESSWNRALRLESYLSSSKQQQAAKRGEMSQILHVM